VATNICVIPRLRMSGAVPLLPIFAVIAWTEGIFFYFTYTRVGTHTALIRNYTLGHAHIYSLLVSND